MTQRCIGPLTWYDVLGGKPELGGVSDADGYDALLACNRCDYVIVAGNFNDDAHALVTDLIHEGL